MWSINNTVRCYYSKQTLTEVLSNITSDYFQTFTYNSWSSFHLIWCYITYTAETASSNNLRINNSVNFTALKNEYYSHLMEKLIITWVSVHKSKLVDGDGLW